jgi:hypothetical protein
MVEFPEGLVGCHLELLELCTGLCLLCRVGEKLAHRVNQVVRVAVATRVQEQWFQEVTCNAFCIVEDIAFLMLVVQEVSRVPVQVVEDLLLP